ncbi:MAG TPA: hypothetical protein VHQ90_09890 [Thermoanaerobaculia bacterium]|nr:hypothetical protein [Thermoanaerobaculia bacterium]
MPRFGSRPRLAAALVAVVLAAAVPVTAAPEGPHALRSALAPAWWSGIGEWLSGAWAKVGCSIDPNGQCKQDAGATPGSGGGVRSPAGAFRAKEGCSIDPNGCIGHSAVPPGGGSRPAGPAPR